MTTYVELQVTSHFSFLRGASAPEELFAAAASQGHSALGLCDRGSVAGMVRGLSGQEATGVRLIPGSRIDLRDGRALLLYPKDRAAWSRMTRLLSIGKARGGKGNCWLDWPDVAAGVEGLVAILVPGEADERTRLDLGELRETFGPDAYLALSLRRRPGDFARLRALDALARGVGVRSVACGDILYHAPERRPLQDVLTAIREKTTIDALGFKRERFMDRALKSPAEMERRFALFPDAIAATADIASACRFDLAEIKYQYPYEEVMAGRSAQEALAALTEEGAARMFPGGVPPAYRKQIDHELRLIGELGYVAAIAPTIGASSIAPLASAPHRERAGWRSSALFAGQADSGDPDSFAAPALQGEPVAAAASPPTERSLSPLFVPRSGSDR